MYKTNARVNVNSPVAILLIVHQSSGLGKEAVNEPFQPRLDTLELLVVR